MNSPFDRIQKTAEFQEELFVSEIQSYLETLLERQGMNRADLARLLGVSRARITQIFSDDCPNLTVRTMARLFFALGEDVTICPREHSKTFTAPEPNFGSDIEDVFSAWIQGTGQSVHITSPVRDLLKDVLRQRQQVPEKSTRTSKAVKAEALDWAKHSENVVSLDERRRANG